MSEQRECHETLVAISNAVRAVDTREFEKRLDAVGELIESMTQRARDTLAVLERVTESFDTCLELDPAADTFEIEGSAASDTAFIARLHLRQRLERLVQTGRSSDPWLVIGESASLRRHIIKSTGEVERAVCEELGLEPRLETNHECNLALASRAAYQRYIRSIRTISARIDKGELEMIPALRLCATNIALLIGRDIYQDLRIGDRQQLYSLQQRLFDAVRHPENELGIHRLWMDIDASAELLERINDRPELVEHDFELVVELLEAGEFDEDTRAPLVMLAGRDRDLDRLLADASATTDELRAGLVALRDRLARTLGRTVPAKAKSELDNVIGLPWT